MRLRAGSRSLIGSERRVALDQLHAVERHAEFFGNELGLCRIQAVSQFALSGVGGDVAVSANGDPRVELIAWSSIDSLGLSEFRNEASCREPDDECAGGFQEFAPGFHRRTSAAYFWIALNIRVFPPHRHSTPAMACCICGAEALGFLSRYAFAVMMMPLMQKPHCMACSSMNAFWIA